MLSTLLLAEEGGFNPLNVTGAGNFVWTLVIFLVALPFMWKMVFSKIAAALNERDAQASEAIRTAVRASEEAEKARAQVELAVAEAQNEAAHLLSEARKRAEVRERDIVESAKKEAGAMIEQAAAAIAAEKDKALAAIRAEVVDLSLHAASKVLGRNVGSEDDRRLVTELVGGAPSPGAGGGGA